LCGTLSWDEFGWAEKVTLASKFADIIKLVGTASSLDDNLALERFRHAHVSKSTIPLIAINMGRAGQLSRVLNPVLTPISHSSLPARAAPGQLSLKEINECLSLIGNIDPLRFFLLGTPIAHSRSPALHNSLFKETGLPHHYSLFETMDAELAMTITRENDFGGASVTIPHKETIIKFLDDLTEEAMAIGAVNTIIPEVRNGRRYLIGDNTDWIGIQSSFRSRDPAGMGRRHPGLVIGNGGTARSAVYSLSRMGVKPIYVACRSPDKLKTMVKYGIVFITSAQEAQKIKVGPVYAVSAIPGNVIVDENLSAIISLLLSSPSTAIERKFLEMAYLPRETESMRRAEKLNWETIPGSVPLILQGLRQFELWTGFKVPIGLGQRAVDGDVCGSESA